MAATLVFEDRGWVVATSSWTAASATEGITRICYLWGADHISFFDSATGTSSINLKLPFARFLDLVSGGGTVDLRDEGKGK